jgi:phospholipid/cholesterol/gamma-HCH transport system permease protein
MWQRIGRMTVTGPPEWCLHCHGSEAELELAGDWTACETGVRSAAEIRRILEEAGDRTLHLDGSRLGHWDSALIVFLKMLQDMVPAAGLQAPRIDTSDLPDTAKQLLTLAGAGRPETQEAQAPPSSLAARVGNAFFEALGETMEMVELVGETALHTCGVATGRVRTRITDVLQLVREAGADALGIVAIVNVLVGAIIAFVGAMQLRRFGAGIYSADLVGIATAREMAPIITAVVMAGRTGAAYAAHLATMQGNEEIDALNAFGIPVYDLLVLPRMIALVTMMPLLYLYACALGLFGGFIVSIATLDLSTAAFLNELRAAVTYRQFAIGLTKSITFGALVALVGCHIGLRAGRSAADVGHAATRAVVVGIVGIIALDAVFAVCTNALGI